jgi:hypothetical protein
MGRFEAIKSDRTPAEAKEPQAVSPDTPSRPDRLASRTGKKAVSGYFSPELSRALHMLVLEQGSTLQALMGEAFDDLFRKYGKHPFGER